VTAVFVTAHFNRQNYRVHDTTAADRIIVIRMIQYNSLRLTCTTRQRLPQLQKLLL
jgi:hypothetical protein